MPPAASAAERPEPGRPDGPADLLREAIASTVRRERLSQGRTLRDLAESARISPAQLSQIEHGNANPTLDVLVRLAQSLRLPFSDLTNADTRTPRIIRAGAGPRWVDRSNGQVSVDVFTSGRKARFVVSNTYLPAGMSASPTSHGARTTEYAYVISGQVRVTCDDWTDELTAGDAVEFPGDAIHTYAAGETAVELLVFVAFDEEQDASGPSDS